MNDLDGNGGSVELTTTGRMALTAAMSILKRTNKYMQNFKSAEELNAAKVVGKQPVSYPVVQPDVLPAAKKQKGRAVQAPKPVPGIIMRHILPAYGKDHASSGMVMGECEECQGVASKPTAVLCCSSCLRSTCRTDLVQEVSHSSALRSAATA